MHPFSGGALPHFASVLSWNTKTFCFAGTTWFLELRLSGCETQRSFTCWSVTVNRWDAESNGFSCSGVLEAMVSSTLMQCVGRP